MSEEAIAPSEDVQDLPEQTQDDDSAVLEVLSEEVHEEPEQEQEKPHYRVKINGTERDVPLDDLLSGYQKGIAADENFRRAAALSKAAEAEKLQAEAVKSQYLQRLDHFIPNQVRYLQALQTELDTLATEDQAQWVQKRHQYDSELAKLHQADAERNRVNAESELERARKFEETIARESEALLKALPEWKDEAKASSERSQISKFLKDSGFDDSAIQNVTDHRHVIVARKAMLYDALMAKVASRKAQPSENTQAPAPPTTTKARGSVQKDPDKMTTEQWMEWRNKSLRGKAA